MESWRESLCFKYFILELGKWRQVQSDFQKSPVCLRTGMDIAWQDAQSRAHPAAGQDPSRVTFPSKSHL